MKIDRPLSKQPIPAHAKQMFHGVLFDVYQWEQRMFDGSMQIFEKLRRADTVTVLPVTESGEIIVIEEEQPGKKPVVTIPGGRLELGEDPFISAQRELREETGYQSAHYELWYADQPTSKIDWAIYCFVAKHCVQVSEPHLDSGEKIAVKYVDFDTFVDLVVSGRFNDQELVMKVMEAKIFPNKMEELRALLGF